MAIARTLKKQSQLFSEELGIALKARTDAELFKWFLASLLFGSHITATLAKNTYRVFKHYRLLTPERIVKAGRAFLIDPIMREGHYVRYDERKSDQIIRDCEKLITDYSGSLNKLHELSKDAADLERRLMDFYGIGPVTANIFLRELRPFWRKANPKPLAEFIKRARRKHILFAHIPRKSMSFVRLEANLIRQLRVEGEARKTRRQPGYAKLIGRHRT